ncbi:hypothetical protein ACRQ5Q_23955 [Bradyrhizobium sp. PMVTL-01]|uniref:hypothetical protein n=1 Tax=Bradyrhizobium sp. PMVTL-01 TaxID=3434999 RepID=UPI003F718467
MVRWFEPILGTVLMAAVLADVFLTVLYARAGTGIMSDRLARLVWLAVRAVASNRNKHLLSFCGPLIVVALLLTWSILLALGAALVVHPLLGTSITNSNQETPTDFVTALYVAGGSLSIVGGSSFGPQRRRWDRLVHLVGNSMAYEVADIDPAMQRTQTPIFLSEHRGGAR